MKLLIADDNPSIRELVRQLCASVATEVRDCCNGAEAIARFAELRPDWAVLDLMMPGMDGLTAAARIKARWPAARIVIITGMRSPEYREAALQAGACAFLLKEELYLLPQILIPEPCSTYEK
jgi:CheY-like chemotaxis protein